tara:strand:+ start:263 stop:637 length:375 start_codon:yes stop_codon:yes gene_type:complete
MVMILSIQAASADPFSEDSFSDVPEQVEPDTKFRNPSWERNFTSARELLELPPQQDTRPKSEYKASRRAELDGCPFPEMGVVAYNTSVDEVMVFSCEDGGSYVVSCAWDRDWTCVSQRVESFCK